MEPDSQSSPCENGVDVNATATFRKPTNDAGSRKYRRRSPVDGSSSSEESPNREHISSPVATWKDHKKANDEQRRKDGGRDLDRDSGRTQYGRGGDSYRDSGHQSSRSSRGYHSSVDYHRHDRFADVADKDYSRSSGHRSRKENDYHSRDYKRDYEKYSRDKAERFGDRSKDREKDSSSHECQKPKEKDVSSDRPGSGRRLSASEDINEEGEIYDGNIDREYRSSRDCKTNYSAAYEDSGRHRNESTSFTDHSGDRHIETRRSDKSQEDGKYRRREKKNFHEMDKVKERNARESDEVYDHRRRHYTNDQDSSAKKSKFGSNGSTAEAVNDTKEKNVTFHGQSTTSKSTEDPSSTGTSQQAGLTDADVDAARLAAMKAAELVNRNLVGTGILSADQKKKLLWGNKKTAATEESGHLWDATSFGDRERLEKFHKLMGVKGDVKVEHKADDPNTEKQREQLQLDLEKQYTAGLRRRDGRTVGLGL